MMKHGFLNESEISGIGIWEEEGEIVAAALYDTDLGNGHFCIKDGFLSLMETEPPTGQRREIYNETCNQPDFRPEK